MVYVTEELMSQANVGKSCHFLRVFSDRPSTAFWVKPPLGSGDSSHLIAGVNGEEAPFAVPENMDLYIVGYCLSSNQKNKIEWLWNDQLYLNMLNLAYSWNYEYGEIKFSTKDLDLLPGVEPPYSIDFIVTNMGNKPLEGTFIAYGIMLEKEE